MLHIKTHIMKKFPQYLLFVIFLGQLPALLAQTGGAEESPYRQFDFWIGEWNVYHTTADTLVGVSKIERIIDGKGILENYHTAGGFKGKSLNTYNATSHEWEQYWIDNAGTVLSLKGGLEDGKMVMGNRTAAGKGFSLNRITWTPLANGHVTQVWEVSQDEGENWQKVFDGTYKPKS